MERVRRSVAACDASDAAPVVIFVSKMIPVKRRDLTDASGRLWQSPNSGKPGEAFSKNLSKGDEGGQHGHQGASVVVAGMGKAWILPRAPGYCTFTQCLLRYLVCCLVTGTTSSFSACCCKILLEESIAQSRP